MTEAALGTSFPASHSFVRHLARNGFWGLADQTLMSVTNFLTAVLVARSVSPREFGLFTLVYSVALLANSLQNALITYPHNILGATRGGEEYVVYTSSTAAIQLFAAAVFACAAVVAGFAAHLAAASVAPLLLALAVAVASWQLQEFARRVLYTEGRLPAALANDVVAYGGQAALVIALWRLQDLTANRALYVLAGTSAAGVCLAVWQLRRSFGRTVQLGVGLENWRLGRWIMAATAGSMLSGMFYLYLAGFVLGSTAAGVLRAAQLVMGPVNIFLFFLNTVLSIRFSNVVSLRGTGALRSELRLSYLLTAPLIVLYLVGVSVFAPSVLALFFGPHYSRYSAVVVLTSVLYLIIYASWIFSPALLAQRMPRAVFAAAMGGGLVSILIGWPAVRFGGVEGTVGGMIASATATSLLLWYAYLRAARRGSWHRTKVDRLLGVAKTSELAGGGGS